MFSVFVIQKAKIKLFYLILIIYTILSIGSKVLMDLDLYILQNFFHMKWATYEYLEMTVFAQMLRVLHTMLTLYFNLER